MAGCSETCVVQLPGSEVEGSIRSDLRSQERVGDPDPDPAAGVEDSQHSTEEGAINRDALASYSSGLLGKWSSLFKASSGSIEGLPLHYVEPASFEGRFVAACPKKIIDEEARLWDNTLLGYFVGRRPPFSLAKDSLLKQWRCSGNVEISMLDSGVFIFSFSSEEDKFSVLERGIWYVQRRPMVLKLWSPQASLSKVALKSIPIWISLPNLPFHLWSMDALSIIGSNVGIPLFSDRWTRSKERLSYARLCIEVSASSELCNSIEIRAEGEVPFMQQVIYDWKPPRCERCQVFGHEDNRCALSPQIPNKSAQLNGDQVNGSKSGFQQVRHRRRRHQGSEHTDSGREEGLDRGSGGNDLCEGDPSNSGGEVAAADSGPVEALRDRGDDGRRPTVREGVGRCEQQQDFLSHANQTSCMQKETNRFTILGALEACAIGGTNGNGVEDVSDTIEEVILGDTHSNLGEVHHVEIEAQQHVLPISCNSQRQQPSGANLQDGNVVSHLVVPRSGTFQRQDPYAAHSHAQGEGASQQEEEGGECRRSTRMRRPVQREWGPREAEVEASSVRGKEDFRKSRREKGATVSTPKVIKEAGSSEGYELGDNREENIDGVSSDEGSPVGGPRYDHVKEIWQGNTSEKEDDIEPCDDQANVEDSDRWVIHERREVDDVMEDILDGRRMSGSQMGGSISIHLSSDGSERNVQLPMRQEEVEKTTSKGGNGESTMAQGKKGKRKNEKSSGKKKNSPKNPKNTNGRKTKH